MLLLDVISPEPTSVAVWVLVTIGAVGGFILVLMYLRRGKRPPPT